MGNEVSRKNAFEIHWPLTTALKDAQGCDLASFFRHLSESENHSEIKPPLESKTIWIKKPVDRVAHFCIMYTESVDNRNS